MRLFKTCAPFLCNFQRNFLVFHYKKQTSATSIRILFQNFSEFLTIIISEILMRVVLRIAALRNVYEANSPQGSRLVSSFSMSTIMSGTTYGTAMPTYGAAMPTYGTAYGATPTYGGYGGYGGAHPMDAATVNRAVSSTGVFFLCVFLY